MCHSLATKHHCVRHFSFHGDWNTAGWDKKNILPIIPPPSLATMQSFWSTDLLTTLGVNMVISAFIQLTGYSLRETTANTYPVKISVCVFICGLKKELVLFWKFDWLVFLLMVVMPFHDHNTQFILVLFICHHFWIWRSIIASFFPQNAAGFPQLMSNSAHRWKHSSSQWE